MLSTGITTVSLPAALRMNGTVSAREYPLTHTKITSGRGSALLPRGKKAVHVDCLDRNALALIFSGYKRQAVLLQDRKMLSACNKCGIRTGFAQIRAYRSANATGTDNHITQLHPLFLRLLFLHYSTKSAMVSTSLWISL